MGTGHFTKAPLQTNTEKKKLRGKEKKNLNKMVALVYVLFGLRLRWFYVVAQCLLTVGRGFVHA